MWFFILPSRLPVYHQTCSAHPFCRHYQLPERHSVDGFHLQLQGNSKYGDRRLGHGSIVSNERDL